MRYHTWLNLGLRAPNRHFNAIHVRQYSAVRADHRALVPIMAGVPIIIVIDRQKRKLNDALAELKGAHSQLEVLNAELDKQARFDYMTGFLNRRYFVQAVNEQCLDAEDGAILCIDVDNFKQINDSFGHLIGDEALKLIAETISGATPKDALLARMGGEEFSVFLQPTDLKTARAVAEQIRKAVEAMTFEPREGITPWALREHRSGLHQKCA